MKPRSVVALSLGVLVLLPVLGGAAAQSAVSQAQTQTQTQTVGPAKSYRMPKGKIKRKARIRREMPRPRTPMSDEELQRIKSQPGPGRKSSPVSPR